MSAVHYVMDGDDTLISTMRARGKARAVARDPKVSLCVLDEQWPPAYLTVYCDAVIDATVDTGLEAVMDVNRRILQAIVGLWSTTGPRPRRWSGAMAGCGCG